MTKPLFAWRHPLPSWSDDWSSQMWIFFRGFCCLSFVSIAPQFMRVDSGQYLFHFRRINWWTRLPRKVRGYRGILFGTDTKRQVRWHQFAAIHHGIRSTKRLPRIEKQKNNPQTCKCCYVRIASGNLSCDLCGCFCRCRLVYFGLPSVVSFQL